MTNPTSPTTDDTMPMDTSTTDPADNANTSVAVIPTTPRAALLAWLQAQATDDSEPGESAASPSFDLVRDQPRTGTTHELVSDLLIMQRVLDMTGGELPAELEPVFDAITTALARKVDRVCDYFDTEEARSAVLAAEIKRLQTRKKAIDSGIERMQGYFVMQMKRMGVTVWEGELGRSFSLRKTAPKLRVVRADKVPSAYQSTEVVVSTDARALLADTKKAGGALYVIEPLTIEAPEGMIYVSVRRDDVDMVSVIEVPDDTPLDDADALQELALSTPPAYLYAADQFVSLQRNPDNPRQCLIEARVLVAETYVDFTPMVR